MDDCESQQLIFKSTPRRSKCGVHVRYRLPLFTEKEAIVVLVWNILMSMAISCGMLNLPRAANVCVLSLAVISFPIAGLVADMWVGRFKILQISIVLLLISTPISVVLSSAQVYHDSSLVSVFLNLSFGLSSIGMGGYIACIVPFLADQLIGASGEELSFSVYWSLWGFGTGRFICSVLENCLENYGTMMSVSLSAILLILASFFLWYWKRSLMTAPQLSNPIKHIAQVLNYARKHKFPQRRSALTYWEEDYPSRLDYGKCKYGGPFTNEEVEDVKTVLRLLPVIFLASSFNLGSSIVWDVHFNGDDVKLNLDKRVINILSKGKDMAIIIAVVGIPIYHFLLYPVLYNYVPTMLQRIGMGLLLISLSYLASAAIEAAVLCSSGVNTSCDIQSYAFNASSNGLYWFLFPSFTFNMGFVLSSVTLIEFVVAQTPRKIWGLMMEFTILSMLLLGGIGMGAQQLVHIVPSQPQLGLNLSFYTNLIISTIIFLSFLGFLLVSKWYKLRQRTDIVPYHMIAENYYEKLHYLEEKYYQQYNSIS